MGQLSPPMLFLYKLTDNPRVPDIINGSLSLMLSFLAKELKSALYTSLYHFRQRHA
jgi:hypothetical protein